MIKVKYTITVLGINEKVSHELVSTQDAVIRETLVNNEYRVIKDRYGYLEGINNNEL